MRARNNHLFVVFHRVRAAFLAISFFLSSESFAARTLPPFIPPFLPIVAKYREMALSLSGKGPGVSVSSVANLTASVWAWLGSDGVLLKRLMHISIR